MSEVEIGFSQLRWPTSLLLAKHFLALSPHGGRQEGKRTFTGTSEALVERERVGEEMQERWRLARWGPDSPFHQEPIPMATVPTHLWEESSLYLSHYFSTLQPEIRLPRRGLSGRHLNCSRPGTMMLPDLAIRSRRLLQTLNRRSRKSRRASRPLLGLAEDKGHWSGSLVDDSPRCGSCSVFTLPCLPSPGLTLPARDWQCTALLHLLQETSSGYRYVSGCTWSPCLL